MKKETYCLVYKKYTENTNPKIVNDAMKLFNMW